MTRLNMKKHTLLMVLVGLFFGSSNAQSEASTLLGKGNLKSWGIVVTPQVQYAEILGNRNAFVGTKAGFVFNDKWIFGAAGGQTVLEIPRFNPDLGIYEELEITQAGIFMEYRLFPNSLVHLSFPLNMGILQTESDSYYSPSPWGPYEVSEEYTNFYLEPGINVELNVSRFIRLQLGASYRFNDAMIAPINSNLKINHHPMFNAGITFGVDDLPKTAKWLKNAIKR